MINKDHFKNNVKDEKEHEWFVPFSDLDIDPPKEGDDPNDRKKAIADKQTELAAWLTEIPGCNWSVGFIDDSEQNAMVVAWWFKDEDYPVDIPEE